MLKRFMEVFFSRKQINFEVLRCDYCLKVVTNFSLKKGILCPCGQNQFRQTNPSLAEKISIVSKYILRGY